MIIGFCGAAYAGKTTSANFLVKNFGFNKVSFAASLKENIGRQIFGLSERQLYGDLKEEMDSRWGVSPRQILQLAGGKLREINGNVWIENLVRKIQAYGKSANVTIDDVRYPNEVTVLTDLGAKIIRVVRPNHSKLSGNAREHSSETALSDYPVDLFFKTIVAEDFESLSTELVELAADLKLSIPTTQPQLELFGA